MDVEIAVSSAAAKKNALAALAAAGFRAGPGRVRLAYPFAVLVSDVEDPGTVTGLIRAIDPEAGQLVASGVLKTGGPTREA